MLTEDDMMVVFGSEEKPGFIMLGQHIVEARQ